MPAASASLRTRSTGPNETVIPPVAHRTSTGCQRQGVGELVAVSRPPPAPAVVALSATGPVPQARQRSGHQHRRCAGRRLRHPPARRRRLGGRRPHRVVGGATRSSWSSPTPPTPPRPAAAAAAAAGAQAGPTWSPSPSSGRSWPCRGPTARRRLPPWRPRRRRWPTSVRRRPRCPAGRRASSGGRATPARTASSCRAGRGGRRRVAGAAGGRRRPGRARRPGHAAPGDGLSAARPRAGPGHHAAPGRPGLGGRLGQGRLPRAGRAAGRAGAGARPGAWPASSVDGRQVPRAGCSGAWSTARRRARSPAATSRRCWSGASPWPSCRPATSPGTAVEVDIRGRRDVPPRRSRETCPFVQKPGLASVAWVTSSPTPTPRSRRCLGSWASTASTTSSPTSPTAVRLAGGLTIDRAAPRPTSSTWLGELAGRTDRRGRVGAGQLVCFAGGGAYDHDIPSAVRAPGLPHRVRHRLHAVPARGGPGRAPGAVRVPDACCAASPGWTSPTPPSTTAPRPRVEGREPGRRGHRPEAGAGCRPGVQPAMPSSRCARCCGHRLRDPVRRRCTTGVTAWPDDPASRRALLLAVSQLPRLSSRTSAGAAELAHGPARCWWSPSTRSPPACCGRRARSAPTWWWGRASRSARRSAFGGPYLGLFACRREHVRRGCPAGWWARRSTPRAAGPTSPRCDPGAGHPPGEGVVQRLHQPDAHRRRAPCIQLAWLGTAGLRELALRCARGTRYTREALLRHRRRRAAGGGAAVLREFAVRTPVAGRRRSSSAWPRRDSSPASPLGDRVRRLGKRCWSPSPRRRTRAEIDAYVAAIEKVVA